MTTPRIEEIVEKFREEFEADRGYGQVPQYVPAHYDFRDYEDWLRQALTQAHQAGIDEEREKWIGNDAWMYLGNELHLFCRQGIEKVKITRNGEVFEFKLPETDDTIKSLQDNK